MGNWVQVTLRTFSLRIEPVTSSSEVKGKRKTHFAGDFYLKKISSGSLVFNYFVGIFYV